MSKETSKKTVVKKAAVAKKAVKKVEKKKAKVTKEKVITTEAIPVSLKTFTLKAVIPTGQYANIQPEIVVEATDYDAALAYVLPKMEALFDQYVNFNDRPRPVVAPVATPAVVTIPVESLKTTNTETSPQSPQVNAQAPVATKAEKVEAINKTKELVNPMEGDNSPAYTNAFNAIKSAKTKAGLAMILGNIQKSTKLSEIERSILIAICNQHVLPENDEAYD